MNKDDIDLLTDTFRARSEAFVVEHGPAGSLALELAQLMDLTAKLSKPQQDPILRKLLGYACAKTVFDMCQILEGEGLARLTELTLEALSARTDMYRAADQHDETFNAALAAIQKAAAGPDLP
mgnify:CR=1 FL=1|jgi:hypothetical protein